MEIASSVGFSIKSNIGPKIGIVRKMIRIGTADLTIQFSLNMSIVTAITIPRNMRARANSTRFTGGDGAVCCGSGGLVSEVDVPFWSMRVLLQYYQLVSIFV
jgi:hypothetical protein